MKKLGLGIQELSELKGNNFIYVDKTKIIHNLITNGKYYFLSRPRRFGKSLLVNTIEAIFKGRKNLFEDTWIYNNWNFEEKYPVIKIGFASLDYDNLGLEYILSDFLDDYAEKFGYELCKKSYPEKFKELIIKLSSQNKVVILIDEYDKPIIDYIEEKERDRAEENRKILKKFYSVIKDSDEYVRLLFITGVSKFSKVSFFSELNNLEDITLDKNYSQIVGYTEKEIVDNYFGYLSKIEEDFGIDENKLLWLMKLWYNGYSWDGVHFMYNPFSVLNLLSGRDFKNYWFKSGTPTFLTKMIREKNIDIDKFESSFEIRESIFDSYDLTNIDINILLFQTGYLTIKEKIVNPEDFSISYKLAYPNKEVKDSFYDFLIGEFTDIDKTDFFEIIKALKNELEINDVDNFILRLKAIYADIPSTIFLKEKEYYYHTVIYLILKLMKAEVVKVEKQTNRGRIDVVIFTKKYIFIMEFKMSNVNDALTQIKEKKYYESYLGDERQIFCVGVAFDKSERNIKEYKVVTVEELVKMN